MERCHAVVSNLTIAKEPPIPHFNDPHKFLAIGPVDRGINMFQRFSLSSTHITHQMHHVSNLGLVHIAIHPINLT